MKKYVKPLMESEAFVANEYIGACWIMSCTCTSETEVISGTTITDAVFGTYGDDVKVYGQRDDDTYVIDGNILGKNGHINDSCSGLDTDVIGGYDCGRYYQEDEWLGGFWYGVCKVAEWWTGNIPETVTVAHHHATLTPTDKRNYPAHPNHS